MSNGSAPTGHIAWPVDAPVWEFDFYRPANATTNRGTGLEIRNLTYLGRKVFERASVPVLNVAYDAGGGGCGCYRDWQYDDSRHLATAAAGGTSNAYYIDAIAGSVVTNCERSTTGPVSDEGNFTGVAVEDYGSELVLTGHMEAGWYRYRMKWHFYTDGRIWPEYSFASAPSSCVSRPRRHHAYWRFDFDLENTPSNDVVTQISGSGAVKTIATEQAILWTDDPLMTWAVTDATTGAGFTIEPGPRDREAPVAVDAFSKFDALVVRYKTNEIDDGITAVTGACDIRHEPWLNGESVNNADNVFWYRSSSARTTGTCELRGPTLTAFGYTPVSIEAPSGAMAQAIEVQAATPNPFTPQTTVRFRVADPQDVHVYLYDALGRRVRTLFEGPVEAGVYETLTISGQDLPTGTYVVRVEGSTAAGSTRIVLAR